MKSYLIVILIGYLLGSSSMSFYVSKLKNVEIRDKGSKNLGASNTMMVLGWKYGVLVGIHDIGKSILAVLLAKYFFPNLELAGFIAGTASSAAPVGVGARKSATKSAMVKSISCPTALIIGVLHS